MSRKNRAILKSLSGLCQNLSAGWFGIVFIVPNIVDIPKIDAYTLTYDLAFGIVFLGFSIIIEYFLNHD